MENNLRRYPGAGPFSEEQASQFCGREADVRRLVQFLARQKQVLVYAKSGVGKSSLINAGLIPALKAEHRRDIKVRFYPYNADAKSPLDRMLEAMPAVQPNSYLKAVLSEADGLWFRFKAHQAENAEALLLVFDQFEELFTYPPDQIQTFKRQISELLYDTVPDRYQVAIDTSKLTDEDSDLLYAPLDLQLVAVIREDKLSFIHQVSDALPDLRHNYFELKPLNRDQARLAITEPAANGKPGDFASDPFTIDPIAVEKILTLLTKGDTVEPTLLQIVCQELETDVIKQSGKRNIVVDDLPKFKDILKDFYASVMGKIPEANEQNKARIFVETELIQGGVRVPVAAVKCIGLISEETLGLLAKEHLIRAEENSTGGHSYELSHDILVEPISELKKEREQAEGERRRLEEAEITERLRLEDAEKVERARLEKERQLKEELQREQAAREKERRQLRRTRMALIGAVVGVLVAGLAFFFAIMQQRAARASEEKALGALDASQKSERRADSLRNISEKLVADYVVADLKRINGELKALEEKAESFKRSLEPALARETLEEGVSMDSTIAKLDARIGGLTEKNLDLLQARTALKMTYERIKKKLN